MGYTLHMTLTGTAFLANVQPTALHAAMSVALLFLKLIQLVERDGTTQIFGVSVSILLNELEGKNIVIRGPFSAMRSNMRAMLTFFGFCPSISGLYGKVVPHITVLCGNNST